MYSLLLRLVFRMSAASLVMRTLTAKVRPVAGRPCANLLLLIGVKIRCCVNGFMEYFVSVFVEGDWGSVEDCVEGGLV